MGNPTNYSPGESQVDLSVDAAHHLLSDSLSASSSAFCLLRKRLYVWTIKQAFQPSVMGRSEDVCAAVPSPSCPGLPASRQARRRNTSVRSDGLPVISGCVWTAKHWAECVPSPARAVQSWAPLKIRVQGVMM